MKKYIKYEKLLRNLHKCNKKGLLDSTEANDIREQMDGLWELLNDEEKEKLSKLSFKLFKISNSFIFTGESNE